MTWLRTPVALTRSTLLLLALVLGLLAAGGLVAGALGLRSANTERTRATTVDALTAKDVAAIARRVFRLEQPVAAALLAKIRGALQACSQDPKCARAFRATSHSPTRHTTTSAPGATPRGATPRSKSPRRVSPKTPRRKPPTPPPSTAPSPTPPVQIQTPNNLPLPHLCTPFVTVNC